jgi:hypothetical protein
MQAILISVAVDILGAVLLAVATAIVGRIAERRAVPATVAAAS